MSIGFLYVLKAALRTMGCGVGLNRQVLDGTQRRTVRDAVTVFAKRAVT